MTTSIGKRPSPPSNFSQNKKARFFGPEHEEEKPQTGAKVDLTYGQRGAFPGLDEDGEEDLFYGPADDGMAYLRMVRHEAKGVPNLLVAPAAAGTARDSKDEDLYQPYGEQNAGWYSDGAYTAMPAVKIAQGLDDQEDQEDWDPQEAFYAALLDRFDDLRHALSLPSPNTSNRPFDASTRSLMSDPKPRHWKHALLKSQPSPVLLSNLPQESVILGIEELEALLTLRNLEGGVRQKIGVWAWSLLGKCRDVSEMGSEDVSVLRELGKTACVLSRKVQLRDPTLKDDIEEEEHGNENGVDAGPPDDMDIKGADLETIVDMKESPETTTSLEDARRKLLSILDKDGAEVGKENGSSENIVLGAEEDMNSASEQVSDAHAMLDMIITIVGECYGQRDLLDQRLAWEEL